MTFVLPPVVGAIDEISKVYKLPWQAKQVIIFGEGRLVGAPAAEYAKQRGARIVIMNEFSQNVAEITKTADIIILGAGKPNLLTLDMVKEGVIVFDAGASEDGGLLVGDASPEVVNKASLFTPVPGGIGPVTVALLFRNLLDLRSRQ
jgi:methylenetetrahydrofolate dehydrogenase (NADP+)/methenyltetrahydrofolate cyclohydrolase